VKTKTQHTPTPWKLVDCGENNAGHPRIEIQGDNVKIADLWGKFGSREWNQEMNANGELIVRAVNSHEALLEAAKNMRDNINAEQSSGGMENYTENFVIAFDDLEKAISKAEAQS
jgi:hypothetical protein